MSSKQIFKAAANGDLAELQALLSDDEINIVDRKGRTLLFVTKEMALLDWLIKKKVDIFHLDKKGQSALHYSLNRGVLSLLQVFQKRQLNLNIRDKKGRTALQMVGFSSLARLQSLGLDINAIDNQGKNFTSWSLSKAVKQQIRAEGASDAHGLYLEGRKVRHQGHPAKALEKLSQALAINNNFANAHIESAVCLIEAAEYQQAISHLVKANRYKPRFALVFYNLGIALDARGDLKNCIKAYNKAIKLDKKFYQAYLNRATVWLGRRYLELAHKDFKLLSEIRTTDADIEYNLACLHALADEEETALKHLKMAIKRGFTDRQKVLQDDDLIKLRRHPQFDKLLSKI